MKRLNKKLLMEVKRAFVPIPGGKAEPVAGASPMTAALTSGGIGSGGAPTDSSAGGGAPIDPSTGMPMDPSTGAPIGPSDAGAPMDPAMAAAGGGAPIDPSTGMPIDPSSGAASSEPTGMIQLTPKEFMAIIETILTGKAAIIANSQGNSDIESNNTGRGNKSSAVSVKLDRILQLLGDRMSQV